MCIALKYGVWNVTQPEMGAVNALVGAGYAPLSAMILAARGMSSGKEAQAYLGCDAPMPDPFEMTDMDLAAGRVSVAISRGEKIAVFGDYDVDGITATCLLTDGNGIQAIAFFRASGDVGYHIRTVAAQKIRQ